ncbi:putative WRKY transcription factor 51 [Bienertia sinuspersici]
MATHDLTSCFLPFSRFYFSVMEGNYHNHNYHPMTTNTVTTTATFSSLDSSGRTEFYDVAGSSSSSNIQNEEKNSIGNVRAKKDVKERVAFRMKLEIDVVDDGYKWRKYARRW